MHRRFLHRMLLIAVALAAGVVVLLPATPAWALAPMCHDSGMSIEAPISPKPARGGVIAPLEDCLTFADSTANPSSDDAVHASLLVAPDKTTSAATFDLPPRVGRVQPIRAPSKEPPVDAARSRVYRPPRSCHSRGTASGTEASSKRVT